MEPEPLKCLAHLTLVIGEVEKDGKTYCDRCGERTMLIYPCDSWSVHSEPYCAGKTDPEAPDEVQVDDEVSGHYCQKCSRITSLSFNEG